ncbi:hypothetical protein K402DRAFT_136060 [Aulographum hederae CBS 113979]|uniref:Uncharacterized protein n=1 Tax=Aulographum hederae CBS 113979 TaxID=1176131 RepID=A0A6G1GV00_9PEZI|nr:hypothetical protein K402DRAFT_136060 [Aulographum hederae CBS 113979]
MLGHLETPCLPGLVCCERGEAEQRNVRDSSGTRIRLESTSRPSLYLYPRPFLDALIRDMVLVFATLLLLQYFDGRAVHRVHANPSDETALMHLVLSGTCVPEQGPSVLMEISRSLSMFLYSDEAHPCFGVWAATFHLCQSSYWLPRSSRLC